MIRKDDRLLKVLCYAAKSGFELSVLAGDIPEKKSPTTEWRVQLTERVLKCQRDYEAAVALMKAVKGRVPAELNGDTVIETTACEWSWNELGCYDTACGGSFEVTHGTAETNGMLYCPFCGKTIRVDEK